MRPSLFVISPRPGTYAPNAPWTAESLALHMQAVIQGAFVLAKAKDGPEVAAECLRHLRRYLQTQFPRRQKRSMSHA